MYTLYHGAGTCSLATKAALALTGAEFTTQTLDLAKGEHQQPPYLNISPLGKVPALVFNHNPEAEVLTEGAAILLFLHQQYPSARLMPTDPLAYANALKWLQMLYATVHPHWSRLFFPERYGNDKASIYQLAEDELFKLYGLIDAQLQKHDYIAGEQLSLADLYLMVTLHWQYALNGSLDENYPQLQTYRQRMYQQPIIGELYQHEFAVANLIP